MLGVVLRPDTGFLGAPTIGSIVGDPYRIEQQTDTASAFYEWSVICPQAATGVLEDLG